MITPVKRSFYNLRNNESLFSVQVWSGLGGFIRTGSFLAGSPWL
jgi:hypothetical protein